MICIVTTRFSCVFYSSFIFNIIFDLLLFMYIEVIIYYQGPDLYAFIRFIGFIVPDDDDINWLLILIFDYWYVTHITGQCSTL